MEAMMYRCKRESRRQKRISQSILFALFAGFIILPQGFAQESSAIPDYYSNNIGWIGNGTELGQPPSGPGPVTFDPAFPYVSNAQASQTGDAANFRVADLNNPILQPWVVDALRAQNDEVHAGGPIFDGKVRCWPPGVPVFLLYPGSPIYFLQTADEVVMIMEQNHQIRRVRMNQPHSENPEPSWYGESVGHYEGGTLVVDTIGFNDRSFIDNYRTPHSTKLHIVERFRFREDGSEPEVIIQIEDPDAFTTPWTAIRKFRTAENRHITESICAENNEHYFNYDIPPIPQDDTPDF
jgi:hypothetical protein